MMTSLEITLETDDLFNRKRILSVDFTACISHILLSSFIQKLTVVAVICHDYVKGNGGDRRGFSDLARINT